MSLTYGRIGFDAARQAELRMGLVQPPTSPVRIRGESLQFGQYYRLEAELGPTLPILKVKLGDVIRPARMSHDNLGLIAYRMRSGSTQEVIPLLVAPDADPAIQRDSRLHVVLRPGIDISNLRWRIRGAGDTPEFRPAPRAEGSVPAGTPLRFDAELPQGSQAILELRFFTQQGREVTDAIRLALQ